MIELKTPEEIEKQRVAGRIVADALLVLKKMMQPGVTTQELDRAAEGFIRDHGAEPAFLGYRGYPASACVSINDEVVHGIPSGRRLEEGDVVSVDLGSLKDGFYGDAAMTFGVGRISPAAERLLAVTRESLDAGIAEAREGRRLYDISAAVQSHVEENGFSVVREYVGHGIGRRMHEDPQVPNFGRAGTGIRLRTGMVLAIEPMVNQGGWEVFTGTDRWTVRTKDGSLSAHFEHTVAITGDGPDILTRPLEG